MATPTPQKTLHLVNQHTFSVKHLEIQHNGKTILWVSTKRKAFSKPITNIQANSENGPIVAACKPESFSRSIRFLIGSSTYPDTATWPLAEAKGFTSGSYEFLFGEGMYQWKRTHSKALGASMLGGKSFKLVDIWNNDKLLAVYIHTKSMFGSEIARIDFFEDLDPKLELASLATILGIQERIRQAERSNAAGGASAGAVGGAGC